MSPTTARRRRRTLRWLGPVVLSLLACASHGRDGARALEAFFEAVQTEDLDTLFCLCAGAAEAGELGSDAAERRANFEVWARARYEGYYEGREDGWIELGDSGIPLVKLFALGRGSFYTYDGNSPEGPDGRRIRTTIRFGYPHLDLSRLSPGTTFYLGGVPVGRVHAVQVPAGREEIRLEVLDRVTVEWTLARARPAAGCPGGWTVAAASPVEGSAAATEVTWVF